MMIPRLLLALGLTMLIALGGCITGDASDPGGTQPSRQIWNDYYLRGISNMTVERAGETWTATTTDGTLASSKVHVGREYTVMSERGGGRGGNVVGIVITNVNGSVASGRVSRYID